MHATIRRYESIDQNRTSELVKKCEESLPPALRDLPGFNGYTLVDSGNGVMTSVGLRPDLRALSAPSNPERTECRAS